MLQGFSVFSSDKTGQKSTLESEMVQARNNMERAYTVEELAFLCHVHVRTVRRWIGDGHVQAFRLPGGLYRIPRSEVDRIRQPMR